MGSSIEPATDRRRRDAALAAFVPAVAAAALRSLLARARLTLPKLLALAAALAALTAGTARAADHIALLSYQEREGLISLTPVCLHRDQQSMLWICTENGLYHFDGFRVRAEPLPPTVGTTLYGGNMDPLGRLWLTTDRGLFVRQLPRREATGADPGPAPWVEVLRDDGKPIDVLYAQQFDVDAHGVLVAYDRDHRYWTARVDTTTTQPVRAQALPMPDHVRAGSSNFFDSSPLRLRDGVVWIGCGDVLCSWDRRGAGVTRWGPAQGLPAESWATLFVGRDGSLWARGRKHLARLAPGARRFEVTAAPSVNLAWEASSPTVEDSEGRILTATDKGLARWDGQRWQTWSHEHGLPDAAVRTLLYDADGALWLGASGQGIHRWLGYGSVDHWTRASGLPSNVVFRILQDGSGRIWAFTRKGAAWFDAPARRFRPLGTLKANGALVTNALIDAAGDLWWLDNGQILTVKAGTTSARLVLHDPAVMALLQGHDDTLYVTSEASVDRLVRSAGRVRREPLAAGLPGGSPVQDLFSDGTTDWFVNGRWHAFALKGGNWVQLQDARGMPVRGTQHVVTAGTLWLADEGHLCAYTLSPTGARLRTRVSTASLGGAAPMWLKPGPAAGELWVGTDRGVFILDQQGAWRDKLDRETGLVWNDTNEASFLIDASGDAWIGTSAGLTRVYRDRRSPPKQAVLRADLLEFGTLRFRSPPQEPVPWSERQLRVTLGTPSFPLARSLRVEYRLSSDAPWRLAEGTSIEVGVLDAGRHLLEVRAAGRVPLEPPGPSLSVPFEVEPPWWKSTGMQLGYAVALGALYWAQAVWTQRRARKRRRELERAIDERTAELEASQAALHRLSEYNAMALEDERKRVSRELHDELGQQLAALRLEVAVMRARATKLAASAGVMATAGATASATAGEAANDRAATGGDPPRGQAVPSIAQLNLLHERIERLVATVRSVVTQLRPPALDGGLEAALRWLASEFTSDTGVPCAVSVQTEANQLPANTGTLIFRIVQESLNNVRRHAEASRVVLKLAHQEGQWTLTVRDDGRGFDPAVRSSGYGLLGMEERARLLGGSLRIVGGPGEGTTVELRLVPGASPAPPP